MKFRLFLLAMFSGMALTACSTMTPSSYAPSADTNVALRKLEAVKVRVANVQDTADYDANCRLMGPIQASGNRSIPEFIKDSFNDEFKFASLYSDAAEAVRLNAVVEKVKFSSSSGLTNGWWELRVRLQNLDTNYELVAETHYAFKSGFDAITACNQTAQALTPAVQKLITQAVENPDFARLLNTEIVARNVGESEDLVTSSQ